LREGVLPALKSLEKKDIIKSEWKKAALGAILLAIDLIFVYS
jgi:hypothetical protein